MRLLVLAAQASVATALELMTHDWDVHSARSVDDVDLDLEPDVAFIDLGSRSANLQACDRLRQFGFTCPCVVVGSPGPARDDVTLLERPFGLEHLEHVLLGLLPPPAPPPPPQPEIAELRPETVLGDAHEPAPTARPDAPANARMADDAPAPRLRDPRWRPPPLRRPELRRTRDVGRRVVGAVRSVKLPRPRRDAVDVPNGDLDAPALARRLRRTQVLRALDDDEAAARLVRELPLLADLPTVADEVADLVVTELGADIVVVWVATEDGHLRVAGHRGLTPAEVRFRVTQDHPLLGPVVGRPEAVLISPLAEVQGLAAGVAGARTTDLAVAPIVHDRTCWGAVSVGATSLSRRDLDRLIEVLDDATPALVFACRTHGPRSDEPVVS